jgi:hypothetical protein
MNHDLRCDFPYLLLQLGYMIRTHSAHESNGRAVPLRGACQYLKVTFDLLDDSRLTEWQYQGQSQSVEIFVFSFCSQAAISAFAENPASSSGLGRAKSRPGAGIEKARCTELREKSGNWFLVVKGPEG